MYIVKHKTKHMHRCRNKKENKTVPHNTFFINNCTLQENLNNNDVPKTFLYKDQRAS